MCTEYQPEERHITYGLSILQLVEERMHATVVLTLRLLPFLF